MDMKKLTAQEIVDDMRIGWNLGNSLESPAPEKPAVTLCDYETSWNNPVTTKAMTDNVIRAGFNTIRIPVTWEKLMGSEPDYTINQEWMDRVQEVVDYAYNEGVYVIIDLHHEDDWLYLGDKEVEERAKKIIRKLWLQIAERFKRYDYHLIFETMNETRLIGTEDEWTPGTEQARKVINEFNLVAVKAIRDTKGNNSSRIIMIKTIGARYNEEAIKDIVVPENDDRIVLAVHVYVPYEFCMVAHRDEYWGTKEDKKEISRIINDIANAAKEKGIPAIIGEFGTIDKKNEDVRVNYIRHFLTEAKRRGITCIAWDNNISYDEIDSLSYGLFNRNQLSWRFPKILEALTDNY